MALRSRRLRTRPTGFTCARSALATSGIGRSRMRRACPMNEHALSVNVSPELVEDIAQRVVEILDGRESSPWLNTEQAAEYIAAPTSRIYDLVSMGRLDPARDGTRLLFHRRDLDGYLGR